MTAALLPSLGAPAHPHLETFPLGPFNPPRLWVGLWQLSSTAWGSAPASRIREAMARHVDQGYTAFGKPQSLLKPFSLFSLIILLYSDMVNPPSFLLSLFSRLTFHSRPAAQLRVCVPLSSSLASLFGAHIPHLADHYGPAEIVFVSNYFLCSPGPLTPTLCQQGQFQEQLPPRTVLGGTKWCVFKHDDVSRATVETAVRERMTRMRTRQLDFLQVRTKFPHYTFLFRPCHLSVQLTHMSLRRPIPV
jgi:hypothetical protein